MKKYSLDRTTALLAALITCAASVGSAQTLMHRYSFNDPADSGTFADSVGGASFMGVVMNAPDAWLDGSQLQMYGFGGFGFLPAGMVSGNPEVTIEFWATLSPLNPVWTRVFSFGDQNGSGQKVTGLDYCHYAGGDWQNLGFTATGGNVWANNPGGLNGTTNVHITCVIDPTGNKMFYYNGTAIRSNPGVNGGAVPAMSGLNDTFGLIGKSLYDVDATLTGSIDEFRIYSGVLGSDRVAINDAAGPDLYVTSTGALQGVELQSPDNPLVVNQVSKQIFKGNFANVTGVDLAAYGGATFTSGNNAVLTVDAKGVVKGIAQGSTTVVASFGGQSATNTLTVTATPATLAHRYSFTTDASDSVGGANGMLMGGASVAGGKVVLDGAFGTYVELPGPAISISTNKSITIEAWVDFGDVPTWSRLWDFGDDGGANEIYLAPRVLNGGEHWVSENFNGGRNITWQGTLSNQTAQVTTVIDPLSGTLAIYRNGKLEYAQYDATAPLSLVSSSLAVIGRSLVGADPYMPGAVDEFRIYKGALTPQEIALTYANGPSSTARDPGVLQSIEVPSMVYPSFAGSMPPVILANYANLAGFNLVPNNSAVASGLSLSSSDTNVIMVLANNMIQTFGPGQVTLTATYWDKTASAVVTVGSTSQLIHRYSFSANANDSVGAADGALQGAASVSGGKLVLDGTDGSYLALPPAILQGYDGITIDTWVDFNAGSSWARLWYFGNDRADEFYLAPIVLDGAQHWFSTGFPIGGATLTLPGRWDNQSLHITAVYGNGTMAYYTNGVLHASTTVSGRMDQIGTWFSWIGRSPHTADAYMNCSIDEFRIYNGRLSPQEIQASDLLGPDGLPSTAAPTLGISAAPGGNILLYWPQAAAGFSVRAKDNLSSGSWDEVTNTPVLVGSEWQLTLPASSTAKFFRLSK